MVRCLISLYVLSFHLIASAQTKDSFCPGAVVPYGIAPPSIIKVPQKYLALDLPFRDRIEIFFNSCIGKDGKIYNLKFLKARIYGSDYSQVEILDSMKLGIDLDTFRAYLNEVLLIPAGDGEGKYNVVCEMIFAFEATQAKKGKKQRDMWRRKFKLFP